jgi:uncharacterized protein YjiS (DUF1127 family)
MERIMDAPYDTTTGFPRSVSFAGSSFGLGRIGTWISERRRIARVTRELAYYSDRDLADMGLTRGEIPLVARGLKPRD